MIFNMTGDGATELRRLTGNYYVGNDFSAIELDIAEATDELISVIGRDVYSEAEGMYLGGGTDKDDYRLVELVQRPIAFLACLNFFRKNDVSHEDSGRKAKVSSDGTDKIPWEWQLDRDDSTHLEQYYRCVESLIRYLNDTENKAWLSSETYKKSQELIITSGRMFDNYFPINKSERLYILISGIIREVQIGIIKPACGSVWDDIVSRPETDMLYAARKALALISFAVALRRLPLNIIPVGVVRGYVPENGMSASDPASLTEIRTVSEWIEADGRHWLDMMKRYRDAVDNVETPYLPDNDKHNKFFRL